MIYFPIHFEINHFFFPYSFSKHSPEGDFHSLSKSTSAFKSVFLFNDTLFHRCVTLMTPGALSFIAFWLWIANREQDCCPPHRSSMLPHGHIQIFIECTPHQCPAPSSLPVLSSHGFTEGLMGRLISLFPISADCYYFFDYWGEFSLITKNRHSPCFSDLNHALKS